MRICHLTSVHQQDDDRIFHKECVSLAKAGFETYLICANGTSTKEKGVEIIGATVKYSSRIGRIRKATKVVLRKAIEVKADVYHFHDPELLLIAKKLKKKTGAKVIYDAHEDLPKQVMDKPWIPSFLRKIISNTVNRVELKVVGKIDGLISVTEGICARFDNVQKNICMIANYPMLEEINLVDSIEKSPRSLCYVGSIFQKRGIKELVQALPLCDAELHLAGEFSEGEFKEEVMALEGWKRVHSYGYVGREEIASILQKSEIGMVTLHPTPSYVESLPIKLFEYMNFKLPVVASDFESWYPYLKDNNCGVFVNPLSPEDIAEKVNILFNDPEKMKLMGENGFKAVHKEYTWKSQGEKLIEFYQSI